MRRTVLTPRLIVIDVTEATFERDVIQRSHDVPVVVDFWADWCAPCRTLGPLLEKLATESNGRWELAKVNVDANQRLATAAGVQGIPAVRAFKDGRQIAEFVGALPEPQVRGWLEQLGPSPAEQAFDEGLKSETSRDLDGAAGHYRRALTLDPNHADSESALARVELALRTKDLNVEELRHRVASDPRDVGAAIGLADLEAAAGDLEAAFERLVEVVRATQGDEREKPRKHLLNLLRTLPPDDPRALNARRALSLALF